MGSYVGLVSEGGFEHPVSFLSQLRTKPTYPMPRQDELRSNLGGYLIYVLLVDVPLLSCPYRSLILSWTFLVHLSSSHPRLFLSLRAFMLFFLSTRIRFFLAGLLCFPHSSFLFTF